MLPYNHWAQGLPTLDSTQYLAVIHYKSVIYTIYQVSLLENLLTLTLLSSMPNLEAIFSAKIGLELPANTLMLGIPGGST